MNNYDNNIFWLDDPSELYKNGNYANFIPKKEMTPIQKLNAATRLCIYISLLLLIFNLTDLLFVPILIIILIILYYKFYLLNNELQNVSHLNNESFENKSKKKDLDNLEHSLRDWEWNLNKIDNIDVFNKDTSYYDNTNLTYNNQLPSHINTSLDNLTENILNPKENLCKLPTEHNPLMNRDITEFGNENIPAACNADDEDVKENIKINFNQNLFRNVDDVWEKENSQRQFYTLPNTGIINNQTEFAKWLYKIPDSAVCKIDGSACLRYEDLRMRTR